MSKIITFISKIKLKELAVVLLVLVLVLDSY